MRNSVLFAACVSVLLLLSSCTSVRTPSPTESLQPVVNVLAKETHSWDGAQLPPYHRGQPEITVLRITIPPGGVLPLHWHPVSSAGVLLSGELTIVDVDGNRVHLEAGDSVIETVETLHYGMNEGSVPTEIIGFFAGAEGVPIKVNEPDADSVQGRSSQ